MIFALAHLLKLSVEIVFVKYNSQNYRVKYYGI